MANNTVNFDSPKSSSAYSVQTTGTVGGLSTAHVIITLNVTNTGTTHPRNDTFYREVDFTNATTTAAAAHGTYSLAIVPKIIGTDTVQVSAVWSY